MNGAESLVEGLVDAGVDVCFANPGTSEMHFVAALDRIEGMRCVLGLFEGIVTGAADGYYRMAERPAATLLHLGPGLANGLANLHNARKARSGIVNIVGDHTTDHLALDAPLTSDLPGISATMSHWVRRSETPDAVAADGREAVARALARPAEIATLILPADMAWSPAAAPVAQGAVHAAARAPVADDALAAAATALRDDPASTLILLGGPALRAGATGWAARIAAATGCSLMTEFYVSRMERGAGRAPIPRLPYAVDAAVAALAPFRQIILVGAVAPVAFFAYPDKPGKLWHPACRFIELASLAHDADQALEALADRVGAAQASPVLTARAPQPTDFGNAALDPASIAAVLSAGLPENAIVVDESISTGRSFDKLTFGAAPHDWLTGMGGSIGFGLPVAVGAAIAAPGRRVVVLEGDGSAMYTPQALWTMARDGLDVTVLIFANRRYQILQGEFMGVGAGKPGARASDMLSIDNPSLDWLALAKGMGVPACSADTAGALADALARSVREPGPSLIEVRL